MDIITYVLCKKYSKTYTDEQISAIAKGMRYKDAVQNFESLPVSGNAQGDVRLVEDIKKLFVWNIEAESGTLDDWKDFGGSIDLSQYYTKAEVDEKIPDISSLATKDELNEGLEGKQDILSVKEGSGFKLINNQLDRDPDIIPTVDYVDMSISDTLSYVDQQDASEHAGRVAGDNLLRAEIEKKQDIIEDLDDIKAGAILGATAVQHDELVFESGTGENSIQTKGTGCQAKGKNSIAKGLRSVAEGEGASAEGLGASAQGEYSHVEGVGTVTNNRGEHAEGIGNKSNADEDMNGNGTISSIGIGNPDDPRFHKNATEVLKDGSAYLINVGDYDGTNPKTAKTIQEVVNNKQDKLKVNEANPTVDLNSLTIGDTIYKIAGEAKIGKTFTTNVTVGNLPSGTAISSDMKIADILYSILFGATPPTEEPDLYIGCFAYPCTVAQFAQKTSEDLIGGVLYNKKASETPFEIYATWGTGEMSVYYIMVKEGCEPKAARMISGGITSDFTAEDIKDTTKWKATHTPIVINGKNYSIYGYRTLWNADDRISITIE